MSNNTFASAQRLGRLQSGRTLSLRGSLTNQRSDFFTFRFVSQPSSGGFSSAYSFSTSGGEVSGQLFRQEGNRRRLVSQFDGNSMGLPRLASGRYLVRLTAVPSVVGSTGEVRYSIQATLN